MNSNRFSVAALTFLLGAASAGSEAHELPANRLSLVLRDETHLSLTYFVDYAEVLHRTLAPKQALLEFIVVYSAMKQGDFEAALVKAATSGTIR